MNTAGWHSTAQDAVRPFQLAVMVTWVPVSEGRMFVTTPSCVTGAAAGLLLVQTI